MPSRNTFRPTEETKLADSHYVPRPTVVDSRVVKTSLISNWEKADKAGLTFCYFANWARKIKVQCTYFI